MDLNLGTSLAGIRAGKIECPSLLLLTSPNETVRLNTSVIFISHL